MKVFRKLRPIFDTHHAHESQISPVAPSWFFTASFFLPFLSHSFFLGKTVSYRELLFFRFSPFFQKRFHTMSSVFIVAMSQKTDDQCELHVQESNDGDQNNEKRVQFVMSDETELLFSITKRIENARHSSKILYGKSDSIIIAMVTSED